VKDEKLWRKDTSGMHRLVILDLKKRYLLFPKHTTNSDISKCSPPEDTSRIDFGGQDLIGTLCDFAKLATNANFAVLNMFLFPPLWPLPPLYFIALTWTPWICRASF